jgi:hypothetical protein
MAVEFVDIADGDLAFSNRPTDTALVYVDGMRGVLVNPETSKMSFFSTTPDPASDGLLARFVLTLAIPTSQFDAMINHLVMIRDQARLRAEAETAPPEEAEGGAA